MLQLYFYTKVGTVMSQLSLKKPLVTDPESTKKKGLIKISASHAKKRPVSEFASRGGSDDIASIGTGVELTRVRKLGYLPSYLKKETKPSVESALHNKYKKFKTAKRELMEQQSNLMKSFEELRFLRDKFRQYGGRDFKIETLELIEFTGENERCGDGDHDITIGDVSQPSEDCASNSHTIDFQQEIQRIRAKAKDGLLKLIEFNSAAFKQIQEFGTEELLYKIQNNFSNVDECAKSLIDEQDACVQFFLNNLRQLRNPLPHPANDAATQEEEIVTLKKAVQNLEIQSRMLQSDIDVKNQEIEYLKNKVIACSKSQENCNDNLLSGDEDQNELRSEISAQRDVINDYRTQITEHSNLQEIFREKIRQLEDQLNEHSNQKETLVSKISQLEDMIEQKNNQTEENFAKFQNDLYVEQKKYDELEKLLEETKNANSMIVQTYEGPSLERVSNQLAAANKEVEELQFKISKREKQIQSLKQIISSESNKKTEYEQLLCKYDELQQQHHHRSKEMQQLKEKLIARSDTINSQILTISELKKKLIAQSAVGFATGPLQDDQITKFSDHERIIQKLENNKIRSNLLRDQLLDRISMLEKENNDMRAQIRKFHEDFTINRFMYDEQRRKKRLTEILVKQYQK